MENRIQKGGYYEKTMIGVKDLERNNVITQKDIEYTDFICFILEQDEWGNQVVIIKSEEKDRFLVSTKEDDEMEMKTVQAEDFYKEFERLVGINSFDKCFVSAKYIDTNSVNLIVNVNGINERYYIDVL